MQAAVEQFKPVSGSATYAADAQLYEQVQARAQRMTQARADNPAAYVLQHPGVAAAAAAAATDPTLRPGAIDTSLAAQDAIGIAPDARRILADPHGAAARIAAMPAAEAPDAIDALRQQYGKYWGQARGELVDAGLPAPYVVLGTLDEPQNAVARTELVRTERIPTPNAHVSKRGHR